MFPLLSYENRLILFRKYLFRITNDLLHFRRRFFKKFIRGITLTIVGNISAARVPAAVMLKYRTPPPHHHRRRRHARYFNYYLRRKQGKTLCVFRFNQPSDHFPYLTFIYLENFPRGGGGGEPHEQLPNVL